MVKICTKCKQEKEINDDNFGKNKYGYNARCKECDKKYLKEYREKRKDYLKKYKEEWYWKNKEEINAKNKEYYYKNKEKMLKINAEYRKNNRDKMNEYNRKYAKKNLKKLLIKTHKRRAKVKNNGGSYSFEQWKECLEFFNYRCAYSGKRLKEEITHADHIIPISKGGTSYIFNICPCLDKVNFSKNNSYLEEWYVKQKYFSEDRLNKIYEWIEYSKNKFPIDVNNNIPQDNTNNTEEE